jgi:formate dehydrogenase maturation protein FdhE
MAAHVEHVDGNALAGVLAELMSTDASTLRITCSHCGRHGELGDVVVERDDVGAIVRCRGCERTLLVILREAGGGIRLRFEATAEISSD